MARIVCDDYNMGFNSLWFFKLKPKTNLVLKLKSKMKTKKDLQLEKVKEFNHMVNLVKEDEFEFDAKFMTSKDKDAKRNTKNKSKLI